MPESAVSTAVLTPHTLGLVVYGTPAPQGSKRYVGRGISIDDNKVALSTRREDVKLAALRALEETPGWERSYPAILAHFWFTLARPAYHFGTGRNAGVLKPNAPRLHASKPDLDKLLRSTFDALTTAGVYADDARVAQCWAMKLYTSKRGDDAALPLPGVRLALTGLDR